MNTAQKWDTVAADLVDDVKRWSVEKGWTVSWGEFLDNAGTAPSSSQADLWIDTSSGRALMQVLRDKVFGADGRIDLMEYPTFNRVMLLYDKKSGWRVRTDSGIDWPNPWGKETFYDLVARLVGGR